jgi:PIN domain nuclease of toxin-antitoxin system
MGGYLLDTHVAIWFLMGIDDKLSPAARRVIESDSGPVYLSVVSGWEMATKINIGKLQFPGNTAGFIRSARAWDITILPIETAHLSTLESLPLIHRDPFDRLLVAAALAEKMTLVSADENIRRYDVPRVW